MNPLTKGKIPFSFLDIDFRKSTVPDVFIKREEILPVKERCWMVSGSVSILRPVVFARIYLQSGPDLLREVNSLPNQRTCPR